MLVTNYQRRIPGSLLDPVNIRIEGPRSNQKWNPQKQRKDSVFSIALYYSSGSLFIIAANIYSLPGTKCSL